MNEKNVSDRQELGKIIANSLFYRQQLELLLGN